MGVDLVGVQRLGLVYGVCAVDGYSRLSRLSHAGSKKLCACSSYLVQ